MAVELNKACVYVKGELFKQKDVVQVGCILGTFNDGVDMPSYYAISAKQS